MLASSATFIRKGYPQQMQVWRSIPCDGNQSGHARRQREAEKSEGRLENSDAGRVSSVEKLCKARKGKPAP